MDLTSVYVEKDKRYLLSRNILHSLIEELKRLKGHEDVLALIKQVLAVGTIDVNAFQVTEIKTRNETYKTTALMIAAQAGMPALVSLLLSAGADTELRNENGLRAADLIQNLPIPDYREAYEMIKEYKHGRVVRKSSLSMFCAPNIPDAQPVLPEYLERPKPSAPPAEDDDIEASLPKSALWM